MPHRVTSSWWRYILSPVVHRHRQPCVGRQSTEDRVLGSDLALSGQSVCWKIVSHTHPHSRVLSELDPRPACNHPGVSTPPGACLRKLARPRDGYSGVHPARSLSITHPTIPSRTHMVGASRMPASSTGVLPVLPEKPVRAPARHTKKTPLRIVRLPYVLDTWSNTTLNCEIFFQAPPVTNDQP